MSKDVCLWGNVMISQSINWPQTQIILYMIHLISMLVMLWTWLHFLCLMKRVANAIFLMRLGILHTPKRSHYWWVSQHDWNVAPSQSPWQPILNTSDDGNPTWCYIYPMALLCNIGQFQVHGLATCFNPLLERLNAISPIMAFTPSDDSRSLFTRYNPYTHQCNQGPGFMMFKKRWWMQHVTGGTHNVAGRMNLTGVKVLAWLCDIALPFVHYHERFTGTNIDKSLQVENVYHIDVSKLHIHIDHRTLNWVSSVLNYQPKCSLICIHK